jgi:RNA polymerase sigma-70 factor (ECF subfamily)
VAGDVHRVLERLKPDQRAILALRDLHGLDEAEAARVLGVARGTVKSRLHRARAVFRREWSA